MKVLGILGSARKHGNTETLLNQALKAASGMGADVEIIRASDKKINPCDGCAACVKTGKCRQDDDMQEVIDKMLDAKAIIFATPVYLWSMTGQLKILLDRTFPLIVPKTRLAGKVGGVIVVQGRNAGHLTIAPIYFYFSATHMLAADWVTGFADTKGQIKKDKHAMKAAWELGKQVVMLSRTGFEFPKEYDVAIMGYMENKYGISKNPIVPKFQV